MAHHIFNISALKQRMLDKPKAQRLENLFSKCEMDGLTEEQTKELIRVIENGTQYVIRYIKDNSPHNI